MNSKVRWLVGVCIGVLLGAFLYWWQVYPYYLSPEAKDARDLQRIEPTLQTRSYVDVVRLYNRITQSRKISSGDVRQLQQLADDKNPIVRDRAIAALSYATQPADVAAALTTIRAKLSDPHGLVRMAALKAMYRMKTPDYFAAREQLRKDPDPALQKALAFLEKRKLL